MRQATIEREHPVGMGGVQKLFRFPNGYGASVVQCPGSYGSGSGRWELAVIKYTGDGDEVYTMTYDTPITDDVVGFLSEREVDDLLAQIEELK